ncbi:MAG: hypothetical protein ACYC23_18555, partial [Limisphaerales bacterium]
NGVALTLRNSLLAGVTTVQSYTGDHTTVLPNDTGVFASVGAGANYLVVGSPHRGVGTGAINATLLNELRAWGATQPPAVWTTTLTTDTVWEPLVERSAGQPDLGYHYPALDYAVSGVTLNNVRLTLTNGVAVAVYGTSGLKLTASAKLASGGTPMLLNRLVRHNAVQEQSLASWSGGASSVLLKDESTAQAGSEVRLRFTELVVPAGGGQHFNGWARLGTLALSDCELTGGALSFNAAGSYARYVALTNSVLDRVNFSLGNGSDSTLTTYARNNLFRACATVNLNAASANAWAWHDNLFDGTTLWQYYGGVGNGNNAYRNCARALTPAGTGNLTLTSLNYGSDAWKRRWYATATPTLVNAGSRTAGAAGLYHYTTQVNQAKEGNTQVDIGFHYVAFCGGTPCDTDSDGLGDVSEDWDGDGLVDAGESNWQDPDSDDDGLPDGAEVVGGTDPTNPDTDYDGLLDSLEPAHGLNPLHPDTDGDGWPDGAEVAPDLELYLHTYSLNATRNFTASPREPVLPDAYVTMTWQHNAAGTLYKSGNRSECLPPTPPPPPETIRTEGDDYAWPATGSGTRLYWKTTYGNAAKQYTPPVEIDRPPSAEINVPWERCTAFELLMAPPQYHPSFTGSYLRSAAALVRLKSAAPTWPKPKRSVILSVQATDKTAGGDLYPGTGYGLGEPVAGTSGVDIDPAVTEIIVDNQPADAAGTVLIQLNKVAEKDVTPQIDVPWYRFDMQKALPKAVTLTWSHHPAITTGLPDIQGAFDGGAALLARDDDGPGNGGVDDDVSCAMEFFIIKSISRIFTGPYTEARYNFVGFPDDLEWLRVACFSNIKLVSEIKIPLPPPNVGFWEPLGYASPDSEGIVYVASALDGLVAVHEYGHACGLEHQTSNPAAVMRDSYTVDANEVNLVEAAALSSFTPGPWNE